jgi:hypothetical protein
MLSGFSLYVGSSIGAVVVIVPYNLILGNAPGTPEPV